MYPDESVKRGVSHKPSIGVIAKPRNIVGLVVFDGEKFLLLHRVLHWKGWEFPKGHIKDGEDVFVAMQRELFEETGIPKLELVGKIDELSYFDNARGVKSFIQNYLVRVSSNNRITFENQSIKDGKKVIEHDDFKWCFPGEAVKKLTHKNMKQTMKKAIAMLGLEMEK
ncbi:MAG: NUDIX domain-containing protein [archaeon]|jgi:8-oxo-dGTP pyrophosphatase MutT (NUDIX family)